MENGFCDKHSFEIAEDFCGACGRSFCAECLLYPFGPKKAPLCLDCAITAGGLRSNAARGRVNNKREMRKRDRSRKRRRRKKQKERKEPSESVPVKAAMDWVALEEAESDPARPVAPPIDEEAPVAASSAGPRESPPTPNINREDLHEVRPSFDG